MHLTLNKRKMSLHIILVYGAHLLLLLLTLEAKVLETRSTSSDPNADYFQSEITDNTDENYDYDISNETVNLHRIQLVDRFETAQEEPLSPELIEEFIKYANSKQKEDPQLPISTMRPSPANSTELAIGGLGGSSRCPEGCYRSFNQECYPNPTSEYSTGNRKVICNSNMVRSSGTRSQLTLFLKILIATLISIQIK